MNLPFSIRNRDNFVEEENKDKSKIFSNSLEKISLLIYQKGVEFTNEIQYPIDNIKDEILSNWVSYQHFNFFILVVCYIFYDDLPEKDISKYEEVENFDYLFNYLLNKYPKIDPEKLKVTIKVYLEKIKLLRRY